MGADLLVVGQFAASDELYLFDPSGPTWTTKTLPAVDEWRSVATDGAGAWVVGGTDQLAVSLDDGATWQVESFTPNDSRFVVTFDGSRFVAADRGVFVSTDGVTWTEVAWPFFNDSFGGVSGVVRWSSDRWVAAIWKGGNTPPAWQRGREQAWTDDIRSTGPFDWDVGSSWVGGSGANNLNITPYTEYSNDRVRHRLVTNGTVMLGLDTDLDSGSWSDDPDGDVWANFTHPTGSGRIVCAAYNPTGNYWVGGGLDSSGVLGWAYSADGKAWKHFAEAGEGAWWLVDACWDGEAFWFAACGAPGASDFTEARLFRAEPVDPSDGDMTWTSQTLPSSTVSGAFAVACWPDPSLRFFPAADTQPFSFVTQPVRRRPVAATTMRYNAVPQPLRARLGGPASFAMTTGTCRRRPVAGGTKVTYDAPDGCRRRPVAGTARIRWTCRPTTPMREGWVVRVVDTDGLVLGHLADFEVGPLKWALNAPMPGAAVTLPTTSPDLGLIVDADGETINELQVFYRGELVAWLTPADVVAGPVTTIVSCTDPFEDLWARHIGRMGEINLVRNGDFAQGLVAWKRGATLGDAVAGPSVNAMSGANALRLESFEGDVTINESKLYQDIVLPPASDVTDYVISAYSWVDPLTPWVPFDPYLIGLYVEVRDPDGQVVRAGMEGGALRDDESRVFWTRKRVSVKVPAHIDPWTLRVNLMSPQGVVFWDHVRCVKVERLEFNGYDQAAIFAAIVNHAQDPAVGKVDLGIGVDCPTTGVHRSQVHPFAALEMVGDVLTELAGREDGCDFAVLYDADEGTKTFTTFFPTRGVTTPDLTVRWGENVAVWSRGLALAAGAGVVAVAGEGSTDEEGRADDRELVAASDPTALGGKLREVIEAKPNGPYVNINQMQSQAAESLAARRSPVTVNVSVEPSDGFDWPALIAASDLVPGDHVAVEIDHGWVQVDEVMRCVGFTLHPDTHSVDLVLAPAVTS